MRVSELTGAALDWAVAKCEGATDEWRRDAPFLWDGVPCIRMDGHDVNYTPSANWVLGGPIIERERMDIECWDFHSMPWKASMWWDDESSSGDIEMYGLTPLIAAMRCYVASKMGDEVEVPTELTQGEVK